MAKKDKKDFKEEVKAEVKAEVKEAEFFVKPLTRLVTPFGDFEANGKFIKVSKELMDHIEKFQLPVERAN